MSDSLEFDYIIVGAGTAGCLLANRLSADPGKRVLLVEAGGSDRHPWIHIPVGYLYCIGNPRTDWCYQTEPDAGLNGRTLRYPRGKALGGCSSINGMIYMRGHRRDYARWAELSGDDGWSWDAVLPYFKRHEDHYMGASRMARRRRRMAHRTPAAALGHPGRLGAGRPCRPACRPATTSTAATTKASATSRSTRRAAGAGTRPRPSCARPACDAPTSGCGPAPR